VVVCAGKQRRRDKGGGIGEVQEGRAVGGGGFQSATMEGQIEQRGKGAGTKRPQKLRGRWGGGALRGTGGVVLVEN